MIRAALWGLAGLLLGLIIHLVIVLALPGFATNTNWDNLSEQVEPGQILVFDRPGPNQPNPLRLDPELTYATCRFDLSLGPGVLSGILPSDFWSIGVFDRDGTAIYSTTNRSGIGDRLELGIFNPAQTRLLAEQQIGIREGLLIIESPHDEIFVVVRLAPPHPVMWSRYRDSLAQLQCGHIEDIGATSGI